MIDPSQFEIANGRFMQLSNFMRLKPAIICILAGTSNAIFDELAKPQDVVNGEIYVC